MNYIRLVNTGMVAAAIDAGLIIQIVNGEGEWVSLTKEDADSGFGIMWDMYFMYAKPLPGRRTDRRPGARAMVDFESGCQVPPRGWWCSREPGHEGPCAAYPKYSHENKLETDVLRTSFHEG